MSLLANDVPSFFTEKGEVVRQKHCQTPLSIPQAFQACSHSLPVHACASEEVSLPRSARPLGPQASGRFPAFLLIFQLALTLLTAVSLKSPLQLASGTPLSPFHLPLQPPVQSHSAFPTILRTQSWFFSLLSQTVSLSNQTCKSSAIKEQAHDLPHNFFSHCSPLQ